MTFIHSPPISGFMRGYDDDQRRWLEDLLEGMGVTATELARRAGLDPSTLTRFLQGDRDGHMLSARTVRKIEKVAQTRRHTGAGFAEEEARPLTADAEPAALLRAAVLAMKGGRNGIDPWQVATDDLEGIRLFRDDILMVDLNATPVAGDIVCAQIYDWAGSRARTVFRLYEPPFLISGAASGASRRPETADGRNVSIRGVVVARLSAREMLHLAS